MLSFLPKYEDERLVGSEREQWEKGYIKAYTEYAGSGVTLHPGEYFKSFVMMARTTCILKRNPAKTAGLILITKILHAMN
ncbi:MAG: hypothetical protein IKD21_05930 [Clostridia bacterium]|nr:hypothetical protein [Clostridia bacterium]